MLADIIILILAVAGILLCAELFTNGIEWFGHILKLSERTIGSVLAAIGTSLPETVVPFVAVISFGKSHGNDVSIGAITGAPFMLVTLAFAACGTSVWFYSLTRRRARGLNIDQTVIVRNLQFFLVVYSIGVSASFVSGYEHLRWLIALCLVLIYPLYVKRTLAAPSDSPGRPERLHLSRLLPRGEPSSAAPIILQVAAGIVGIIYGAYVFVDHLQAIAGSFHVSPLLMSLVLTPIATELPEQATSIMWARRGKDTLALGNISGSMVFQSCFPVAFGVACTSWKLDTQVMATVFVSLGLATAYMIMAKKKILTPAHLMWGALVYAATMAGIACSTKW